MATFLVASGETVSNVVSGVTAGPFQVDVPSLSTPTWVAVQLSINTALEGPVCAEDGLGTTFVVYSGAGPASVTVPHLNKHASFAWITIANQQVNPASGGTAFAGVTVAPFVAPGGTKIPTTIPQSGTAGVAFILHSGSGSAVKRADFRTMANKAVFFETRQGSFGAWTSYGGSGPYCVASGNCYSFCVVDSIAVDSGTTFGRLVSSVAVLAPFSGSVILS
jgi:hypothetical protein